VIYCVVPEALADELYDKLATYYAHDPEVEVIIDRRQGARRGRGPAEPGEREQRAVRDRRRQRVPGELPVFDPE